MKILSAKQETGPLNTKKCPKLDGGETIHGIYAENGKGNSRGIKAKKKKKAVG